jgi:hypothetical protein
VSEVPMMVKEIGGSSRSRSQGEKKRAWIRNDKRLPLVSSR